MKKKMRKKAAPRGLDPNKTQKYMIVGVILFPAALMLLSIIKEQGAITDRQGIIIAFVFGAFSLITIVIDTLAQNKEVIILRIIGFLLLLGIAYFRYFA
ncbi:hypothetical protein [Paenibacillus senegalensis]|uniref:hypothetical protein n=1 Tax=Paenibacillus senegalensis TaxID=1465766 RepID=UPI0002894A4D|nr:hypothetical protein [Paenibacillus senegalensis]